VKTSRGHADMVRMKVIDAINDPHLHMPDSFIGNPDTVSGRGSIKTDRTLDQSGPITGDVRCVRPPDFNQTLRGSMDRHKNVPGGGGYITVLD
jgi:hypothetical protein